MTHCRVPPELSVRARARNERFLFDSIGRCVRVEERQRPHTTYTLDEHSAVEAASALDLDGALYKTQWRRSAIRVRCARAHDSALYHDAALSAIFMCN
ncbi:hypothetical protein EVAR_86027_1 [Eumeta japonica]|uniref:Uncharacterized protein n=1 Tax=Eumeta variegata TaxID=151549 RepID=A0A4C1UJD2_EUMVA|nr:hypothetical protein EVAR_86027_1 [Eumeta japonica]